MPNVCKQKYCTERVSYHWRLTMAVDKRAEDVFRSLKRRCSGTQFFGRIDFQSTHLQLVRVAIARAAPAAYDKKCNFRAGCRQTNYLIRWTQAARGTAGWATVRLFLASSFLFIPLKFSQPIALHTLFPILFLFHSRNFFLSLPLKSHFFWSDNSDEK